MISPTQPSALYVPSLWKRYHILSSHTGQIFACHTFIPRPNLPAGPVDMTLHASLRSLLFSALYLHLLSPTCHVPLLDCFHDSLDLTDSNSFLLPYCQHQVIRSNSKPNHNTTSLKLLQWLPSDLMICTKCLSKAWPSSETRHQWLGPASLPCSPRHRATVCTVPSAKSLVSLFGLLNSKPPFRSQQSHHFPQAGSLISLPYNRLLQHIFPLKAPDLDAILHLVDLHSMQVFESYLFSHQSYH